MDVIENPAVSGIANARNHVTSEVLSCYWKERIFGIPVDCAFAVERYGNDSWERSMGGVQMAVIPKPETNSL